jgi:hypothetical protein
LRYEFLDTPAPREAVNYWLAEVDRSGSTTWQGPISLGPMIALPRPALTRITPNPVVRNARIEYSLPQPGHVRLTVHDLSGRQVAVLQDQDQEAGVHTFDWVPNRIKRLSFGFYVVRLQAGGVDAARKVLVLP